MEIVTYEKKKRNKRREEEDLYHYKGNKVKVE